MQLDTIESAIEAIRKGELVIVVDDEDRENEGDLICAAEIVTPEMINYMATHGRGLVCTPIEEKRADELQLNPMVASNSALHETAFTVSIDLLGHGCSTGISAYDRATGIRHICNPRAQPSDYARPGHIFPLRAKPGGVLRRTGHTEAAVDLARLAGFFPAGVLVEILNEDGSMARLPQLLEMSKRMNLRIISIDHLVAYRLSKETLVQKHTEQIMQTAFGAFKVTTFKDITTGDIHLALTKGEWTADEPIAVRVHSSSETGDLLGTLLKNYGMQTHNALQIIAKEGRGVFLFMRQHMDGSQLLEKLMQYEQLSKEGNLDKFELQATLGQKDFGVGAQILRELGVGKMKLLTNHPRKRTGFIGFGLEIIENIEI